MRIKAVESKNRIKSGYQARKKTGLGPVLLSPEATKASAIETPFGLSVGLGGPLSSLSHCPPWSLVLFGRFLYSLLGPPMCVWGPVG